MPYSIFDVELTQQIPFLDIPQKHTGIAILLRHNGRPIDFWMWEAPTNEGTSPREFAHLVSEKLRDRLLAEKIREEIRIPTPHPSPPTLTVAICTKDRPEKLVRCLSSLTMLQDSSRRDHSPFEILVVDNAPSDDGTRQLVAAASGVRYVCEPLPGLDIARNRAVHEARGEWIAYLDDDVVVDRYWLDGFREAWRENPDAGAVTGLVLPYELETAAQIQFEQGGGFRAGFEKRRAGPTLPGSRSYPCNPGRFGTGANMAFSRNVLLGIGGFDEALDTGATLPGGGDLDIFYRVIRGGFHLIYEPRYLVFHQHRRSLQELQWQYWTWGLCFITFLSKTYTTDPSQRPKIRRVTIHWFLSLMRRWGKCILGRNKELSHKMVGAEIMGGIKGLFGEYSRSKRRIARIIREGGKKHEHPQTLENPAR